MSKFNVGDIIRLTNTEMIDGRVRCRTSQGGYFYVNRDRYNIISITGSNYLIGVGNIPIAAVSEENIESCDADKSWDDHGFSIGDKVEIREGTMGYTGFDLPSGVKPHIPYVIGLITCDRIVLYNNRKRLVCAVKADDVEVYNEGN